MSSALFPTSSVENRKRDLKQRVSESWRSVNATTPIKQSIIQLQVLESQKLVRFKQKSGITDKEKET
jgi:hypothetical protein